MHTMIPGLPVAVAVRVDGERNSIKVKMEVGDIVTVVVNGEENSIKVKMEVWGITTVAVRVDGEVNSIKVKLMEATVDVVEAGMMEAGVVDGTMNKMMVWMNGRMKGVGMKMIISRLLNRTTDHLRRAAG